MAGGLVYFWEQWDIQILVVLSFSLQVILLLFAGIRRREGSSMLRILLWLAYQMADFTAIYALGHMSISSRSGDQFIVAFWAPLLLLHLGGPDTITAYAFEDNQLWLRHLLTLVGQVTGAAYVLYQFIVAARNPVTLLAAAVLMFISGFLKYGERTWALKCASLENIASSLDKQQLVGGGDGRRRSPYHGREGGARLDTEDVLLGAYCVFNVCKSQFIDGLAMNVSEYAVIAQGVQLNRDMYMYEVVEMELSLMYDILYTKAAVIHTWYGYCIRIISSLSAVAALVLFQFSSKDANSRVDVVISYVLLVGALVLEMATSIRAAGSSWACASFHARGWHGLQRLVMRFRRLVHAARRRRTCLDSLGQYNLFDLCTRHVDDRRGKIAKAVGLEDWWNKLHYSSTVKISEDIKAMVLDDIRKRRRKDMGKRRVHEHDEGEMREQPYKDLMWCVDDIELDHRILVWHIATDLYLSRCPELEKAAGSSTTSAAAVNVIVNTIRVLSNHMLFLLVVHPYLLPGVVRHSRYKENCMYFSELWRARSTPEDRMNPSGAMKAKKIAEWELPANSSYLSGNDDGGVADGRASVDGPRLAGILLANKWSMATSDMLQLIAGVWVEMLCYAGHHCGEESHARKLSSGGEFMTAVWLLMGHASMCQSIADASSVGAGDGYAQSTGDGVQKTFVGVAERMTGPPTVWIPVSPTRQRSAS